ncbi:hypothetical protein GCM10010174_34680 [Kutzneria viridogrisea]|uniref:Pullulanase-type alpha-1,6-glucosidase n=1 Tax=Kutzneria viridogrisea TaxID=47990 RepID=A0ABR6BLC9_9PSEU|nr:pullulanase-type alpha-1,6-glucosidase [Kutzneria viridogrisea]
MRALIAAVLLLSMVVAVPSPAPTTPAQAVWVSQDRLVWHAPTAAVGSYRLRTSAGDLPLTPDPAGLPPELAHKFPNLRGEPTFRVPTGSVDQALRGQLAVQQLAGGVVVAGAGVQTAGVLDDRYAAAATKLAYGPVFGPHGVTLRVWAPTANSVRLKLIGEDRPREMRRDNASGSWSITGPDSWRDRYYLYEVTDWRRTTTVTDPYSVALSMDSTYSQIADLDQPRTMPEGWREEIAHGLGDNPTRHAITELHLRDFSVSDPTVPQADQGTYLAFTHRDSAGMRHLRELAQAGMDTVHLQPTFDLSSVPEDPANQQVPHCRLTELPSNSPAQQECVGWVVASDAYNWGYDPWHYTVPEGSYATAGARSGWGRSEQYRQMVQALHANGDKVVVDVVYNHTPASGDAPHSVLDRIVPGYYQRLLPNGSVADSTCCANTAPENAMMGKLVVDSVVSWARLYKVDGFRFDMMGHHPKANILAVRAALDALTPQRDGVDGRAIRIYGEGWDSGEVAGGARFVQATQANLAGTGIGTFNDRIRDAVRGGRPTDADPRVQGLGSGLAGDLNGDPVNEGRGARLADYGDLVRLGMAGNLGAYRFRSTRGATVSGHEIGYNGVPAGYAAIPQEAVNYVDAHDNETLYDALTYKLPRATSMADRVRMQQLALAPVLLGQGQPFVLAGTEFLRSKSFDPNSYDSGDWFNRYDPTLATSTFGAGLPLAKDKWAHSAPLLADRALKPSTSDMRAALAATLRLLRIRQSSALFTLDDPALVQAKVSFPDPRAAPGVLVEYLDDTAGPHVDPGHSGLLVVLNPRPQPQSVAVPGGARWRPHEDQDGSGLVFGADRVRVPARSVVVLAR